jgi:DNA-binding CsgD family transcriptional regulator
MTYIYCLKDGEQVYYVGKTNNINKRKYAHIRKSFQRIDMKDIIIQRQLKDGNDIELYVLEVCEDDKADEVEIQWIRKISSQGVQLSNIVHNTLLTAIEINILALVANGHTSKEIASIRQRSVKTIEAIRYNMIKKIGVNSFSQLVYWAMKNNIIV